MDVADPITTLIPRPDGPVLRVLARAGSPLTGRTVARLAEASQATVARALSRLVEGGLVVRRDHPPVALYELNREHLAAPALLLAADMSRTLFRRIEEHVAGWPIAPVNVTLFGSAARRDGTPRSDIDLLVIRPETIADDDLWTTGGFDLRMAVGSWTGNDVQVIEYGESEFRDRWREGGAFVREVVETGLTLAGMRLEEMVRKVESPKPRRRPR